MIRWVTWVLEHARVIPKTEKIQSFHLHLEWSIVKRYFSYICPHYLLFKWYLSLILFIIHILQDSHFRLIQLHNLWLHHFALTISGQNRLQTTLRNPWLVVLWRCSYPRILWDSHISVFCSPTTRLVLLSSGTVRVGSYIRYLMK